MKTKKTTTAFTLVELIVVITILAILGATGFYSYTKSIDDARDSTRKTDITTLSSQLNLYKQQRGAYPLPGNAFNLKNRTALVAQQGYMNKNVRLTTAERIPLDPYIDVPYSYAVTNNRQEYQLAGSIENGDTPFTYLVGDYKSVANQILPSILLAISSESDVDVTANNEKFLFNNGYRTLPYDFSSGQPYYDGTSSFNDLWADAQSDYWQNTDYRSCEEINLAGKNISKTGENNDEYQILSSTGSLQDTTCNGTL